ncbi:arginyl-tRNA synthetase [Rivularia sp. PCC 7116]|uniref:DALR anticodon-binding domain-containing protein n=1 Tax=Rivularia sp. PCC 7116 TaxID=373994 RepID=UPI00029ED725|nr:DALR anticodon-binding domain-containing protein [Rivularia sp. PCC 7116]AFY53766.1 arginyl-tRNA synthetase [Rivularia sp. PCC 7116]
MLSSVSYVHQKLLVSKYTAILQLIYGQLTRAVSIYALSEGNKSIEKKYIPLSRGKSDIKISYMSGVALHLSKSHKSQTFSIANSIASCLSASNGGYLQLEILHSGLIEIQVSDLFLAAWLQGFTDNNPSREGSNINFLAFKPASRMVVSELNSKVFSVQYVHARCCSLLRLAQQQKLIDCDEFSSESIPWLKDDGKLILNHQAERCLIANLVRLIDELEPVIARPLKWEGAALSLVIAFEGFWSACRIHDDSNTTSPEIKMARIGLIMATQSAIRFLLEEKLGIPACSEL